MVAIFVEFVEWFVIVFESSALPQGLEDVMTGGSARRFTILCWESTNIGNRKGRSTDAERRRHV